MRHVPEIDDATHLSVGDQDVVEHKIAVDCLSPEPPEHRGRLLLEPVKHPGDDPLAAIAFDVRQHRSKVRRMLQIPLQRPPGPSMEESAEGSPDAGDRHAEGSQLVDREVRRLDD
jgi:hypothetical protein